MSTISVYGIWHRFTQQVYIGHSMNTERRFASHRNALHRGDHHCARLQRAWNRDGELAFDFRTLAVCASKREAVELEQTMLDAYFSQGNLYNSVGTNDPRKFVHQVHTKEAREKNRIARNSSASVQKAQQKNVRKMHTPEAIARRVASTYASGKWCAGQRVSVIATCIYSGCVIRFSSCADAARYLGLSRGNISMCLNGKRNQSSGFRFEKAAA